MNEGIHKSLEPVHMIFLLLVLTHSEEVEDQRLCYKEYLILEEKLGAEDPLRCFNGIFKKHLDVVEKYGRFPHRNTIHERQNTPEEDEFLLDGAFRFDLPVRKNAEGNITFARDGKQLWKVLKTKGLTHKQSFQEVAIEAQRRSSYLSLYGGHEEETSEDTKKFYYEEHVNGKFYRDDRVELRLSLSTYILSRVQMIHKTISLYLSIKMSLPHSFASVMLRLTFRLSPRKGTSNFMMITLVKMKATLGVCFFSTPKRFRLFALPSWDRQPNFRGKIH
jgi:hypothetical protein